MTERTVLSPQQVMECLEYCRNSGYQSITLVLPFKVAPEALDLLLANKKMIKGVVVKFEACTPPGFEPREIGRFLPGQYQWQLPESTASTVVFLGPRSYLSFYSVHGTVYRGIMRVVYHGPLIWHTETTIGFLAHRLFEYARYVIYQIWLRMSELWKALEQRISGVAWLGEKLQRIRAMIADKIEYSAFDAFLRSLKTYDKPMLAKEEFIRGRVMLINSSLAWGGAERQIVNTLIGLKSRGITDISVVAEHLSDRTDHDFYLWQLVEAGIEVRQLNKVIQTSESIDPKFAEALDASVKHLPRHCADDVLYYALEFLRSRPEVIHAWQDSTSILAGIAAVLVGVPRIVLASRNMAPFNFPYYRGYMRPAYRSLAARENVVLVNNSLRGAQDYARWLGLDESRYRVVFNGISDEKLKRPNPAAVKDYKQGIGIDAGAPVVGSVFRFYKEKDPLLWVNTISAVARHRPDVRFLLIGTGVMHGEIVNAAARNGISNRLFMPGTEKNIALAMSAMDVFLLTSRFEGTPNVVIEAQMLGVPIVATGAGGTRDAVDVGSSGFVIDSRDPGALAERVLYVLDSPTWAAKARVRGEQFARKRFGIDRMIDEMLEIYGIAKNLNASLSKKAENHS